MSGFTSYALLGLGNLGAPIATEALALGYKLRILTRDASRATLKEFEAKGAKIVQVDYSSEASLEKALEGVQVIISTLGHSEETLKQQAGPVIQAAKAAGVQLYIPSDFGLDYAAEAIKDSAVAQGKLALRKPIEEAGIVWLSIVNSAFSSWLINPLFGFDVRAHKAVVPSGAKSFETTSLPDIARFTLLATQLPLSSHGKGRVLRVSSFTTSFPELVAHAEKQTGAKFAVTQRPLEEIEAASKDWSKPQVAFPAWLNYHIAVNSQYANDNAVVGFEPKATLADVPVPQ